MTVEETADPEIESEDGLEPFDESRARAKIRKANQEAENLRKRLKELEPKASQFDELQEQQKTETQRLADQQTALEARAGLAEMEAARLRIALSKGLTETQAKRLIGSTTEELEADADELMSSFAPQTVDTERPPGRPVERLRGGTDPNPAPEPDIRDVVAGIPRGF